MITLITQSEQALEDELVTQLVGLGYDKVAVTDEVSMLTNLKAQLEAFNGLTLTAANVVVYYSNSFDLEKRLQSEDRAHRIGQTNKVTYVDLIAKDTVDEHIVQALRNKINIASQVLGEDFKDWII